MKSDVIITVDSKTSMVYKDQSVIGISFENIMSNIIFKFENGFVDGAAWLEIEKPDGTKGYVPMEKNEETYTLPIKSSLLTQEGRLYLQLRITKIQEGESIPVFKSNIFYLNVLEAINSTIIVPEEYPSWIDIINNKVDKEEGKGLSTNDYTDEDKEKVDIIDVEGDGTKYLADDGTYKEVQASGNVDDVLVNGTSVVENRIANVEVPTKTSDLENDSDFVEDANYVHTDNNFTTSEKTKLAGLSNYDDTVVRQNIETLFETTEEHDLSIQNLENDIDRIDDDIQDIELQVNDIQDVIPEQATTSNQLADKNFVNSSLNSITAFYITKDAQGSQFNTKAELNNATVFYSGGEVRVPTRNDYCIVLADESKTDPITSENPTTRYIYQINSWEFQYIVNKTTLTAQQLSAINSGITSSGVNQIETNRTDILTKQDTLISGTNIKTINNTSILGTGNIPIVEPIVFDIGSYQYTYDSYILPAISVANARTIYANDKLGVPQVLLWTLYGNESQFKVVSSDEIAGIYSFDILVHNKYHCSYSWDDETTGTINPQVMSSDVNVEIDNSSITKNTDDELQTVGVIDQKTGNTNKQWTGTLAQYEAITTKDANTMYIITDDDVDNRVPSGGTTGQALVKASNTDFDTEWKTLPTVEMVVTLQDDTTQTYTIYGSVQS